MCVTFVTCEQGLASDPIRSDPIRSDPFRSGVATPEVPVASYNPVLSSLPSFITHNPPRNSSTRALSPWTSYRRRVGRAIDSRDRGPGPP